MRARKGNAFEENIGAAVKTASIRKNGHSMGDTQAISWASVRVITLGCQTQTTEDGMASITRRMYSTSMFSIQGPAMANTATAAISLGTNASVAS